MFSEINITVLAILSLLALITGYLDLRIIRLVQFLALFFTSLLSTIDSYNSFSGIGLLIMTIILGIKYKYFEKYTLIKILICGSIYAAVLLVVAFAKIAETNNILKVIGSIIFLSTMVIFFLILYRSEIREYIKNQQKYTSDISRLKSDRDILIRKVTQDKEKIVRLDQKIKVLEEEQQPLNYKSYGISPAEEKIIRTLCVYRCENSEIAHRLNLSIPTVKTHLSHIMDKLGVDDRFAVIDMCRYNYKKT
jgi:DNA-binding CsgD family transcriptional regulator